MKLKIFLLSLLFSGSLFSQQYIVGNFGLGSKMILQKDFINTIVIYEDGHLSCNDSLNIEFLNPILVKSINCGMLKIIPKDSLKEVKIILKKNEVVIDTFVFTVFDYDSEPRIYQFPQINCHSCPAYNIVFDSLECYSKNQNTKYSIQSFTVGFYRNNSLENSFYCIGSYLSSDAKKYIHDNFRSKDYLIIEANVFIEKKLKVVYYKARVD